MAYNDEMKKRRKEAKNAPHAVSKKGIVQKFIRFFNDDTATRAKIKKTNTFTYQPSDALRMGGKVRKLTAEEKAQIETDVYSCITQALSDSQTLYENVEMYFAAYGLEHNDDGETSDGRTDMPWPDASDLTIPTIYSETNSMHAYIVASAFVPRTIIVTGNTKEAAAKAALVENFYNAELKRFRQDGKSWHQNLLIGPQLGLIQGVAPYDIRVEETVKRLPVVTPVIETDDQGAPVYDENGNTQTSEKYTYTTKKIREVVINPRYLRDVLLIPFTARTLKEAVAVAYSELYYEQELLAMVSKGFLDKDAVQYILNMYPDGSSSVESDRQGSWDKTLNSQVSAGGQGSVTSRFFRNRGPFKIWMYLTNQFDFDEDGATEWNWIAMFDDTPTYLGYMPFEYIVGRPPSVFYAPLPRPNRIVGFSICEHLMDLTCEMSSLANDINNYLAQIVNPTGLQDVNSIIEEEGEYTSYPGRVNLVDPPAGKSVGDVFSWFRPPPLPQEIPQFIAYLEKWVSKVTGMNAPAIGAQGPGKRSATENRIQSQATATRVGLAVLQYRFFLREVFNYVHALYLQYPPTELTFTHNGEQQTLDPKDLALDYTIDIAGISDPNDINARRQELIMLGGLLMKFPEIMQNAVHRRKFLQKILEAWQWLDIDDMIGTNEDAKALQGQEAQQAQQQQVVQQADQVKQAVGG